MGIYREPESNCTGHARVQGTQRQQQELVRLPLFAALYILERFTVREPGSDERKFESRSEVFVGFAKKFRLFFDAQVCG